MQDRLYTEALAEAYASAPDGPPGDDKMTVELRHPGLDGPMRWVNDVVDHEFRIEAGAPNGAGEMKTFTGVPFQFGWPAIGPDSVPEMPFVLDNVNRELMPEIEAIVAVRAAMKIRARVYLLSDPEEVAWGPRELVLVGGVFSGSRFTSVARLAALHQLDFPRGTYGRDRFPGLF